MRAMRAEEAHISISTRGMSYHSCSAAARLLLRLLTGRLPGVPAQTASLAVGVGSACTLYEPRIVLEALCLTSAIVLGLTAYTFHAARKGHSFQRLGPILFTGARCPPACKPAKEPYSPRDRSFQRMGAKPFHGDKLPHALAPVLHHRHTHAGEGAAAGMRPMRASVASH